MNKILNLLIVLIFSTINLFSQKYPIITNPNSVGVAPISQLNSQMRETNISITPDGRYMYFMSDRGGQAWSSYSGTFRGKLRYDGDIWFSEYKNGRWG
ncbi:MAG: PD40 domain-containing protein, partial [Bacteroidales bacterium]|nr:PD40 domain-containing protein [Bacteroidales bacterium]